MELRAAIEGLQRVPTAAPVELITDSTYLQRGINEWLALWQRRGWQTRSGKPVENQDLWQALAALLGGRVDVKHVYGHTGDEENERANTIAQAYAAGRRPPPPGTAAASTARPVTPAAATAPTTGQPDANIARQVAAARPARTSYLSLVNGELARHTTWEQCRARVHGVSGARHKKCTSAEQEIATITGWGLPAAALLALAKGRTHTR
jgi:ribonuclease HI